MNITPRPAARRWIKHVRNGFDSSARIQRNYYAFLIMVTIMGDAKCVGCSAPYEAGSFQVDRVNGSETDANGSEVYTEGTIVYLCQTCNQSRALLQRTGDDWRGIAEYASLVDAASEVVSVPTVRESREWWNGRGQVASTCRFA